MTRKYADAFHSDADRARKRCGIPLDDADRAPWLDALAAAIDGRLRWRKWTTPEGQNRSAVDIVDENVQFLGGRDDAGSGNGFSSSVRPAESDVPIDTGDFETSRVGSSAAADDDIPF